MWYLDEIHRNDDSDDDKSSGNEDIDDKDDEDVHYNGEDNASDTDSVTKGDNDVDGREVVNNNNNNDDNNNNNNHITALKTNSFCYQDVLIVDLSLEWLYGFCKLCLL